MYAKRVLTIPELEGALCTELGISKWHDFIGDLKLSQCCEFIIRIENNTVSFIHQAIRTLNIPLEYGCILNYKSFCRID
jgi:hypothetical protein